MKHILQNVNLGLVSLLGRCYGAQALFYSAPTEVLYSVTLSKCRDALSDSCGRVTRKRYRPAIVRNLRYVTQNGKEILSYSHLSLSLLKRERERRERQE